MGGHERRRAERVQRAAPDLAGELLGCPADTDDAEVELWPVEAGEALALEQRLEVVLAPGAHRDPVADRKPGEAGGLLVEEDLVRRAGIGKASGEHAGPVHVHPVDAVRVGQDGDVGDRLVGREAVDEEPGRRRLDLGHALDGREHRLDRDPRRIGLW